MCSVPSVICTYPGHSNRSGRLAITKESLLVFGALEVWRRPQALLSIAGPRLLVQPVPRPVPFTFVLAKRGDIWLIAHHRSSALSPPSK
jgi:hypothetical protein